MSNIKFDKVALRMEADPPIWTSTNGQNQPIYDAPLYFTVAFEPVM